MSDDQIVKGDPNSDPHWFDPIWKELNNRIQNLTPEQMRDTSAEDARTAENLKMAKELHEERLKEDPEYAEWWQSCLDSLTPEQRAKIENDVAVPDEGLS